MVCDLLVGVESLADAFVERAREQPFFVPNESAGARSPLSFKFFVVPPLVQLIDVLAHLADSQPSLGSLVIIIWYVSLLLEKFIFFI